MVAMRPSICPAWLHVVHQLALSLHVCVTCTGVQLLPEMGEVEPLVVPALLGRISTEIPSPLTCDEKAGCLLLTLAILTWAGYIVWLCSGCG